MYSNKATYYIKNGKVYQDLYGYMGFENKSEAKKYLKDKTREKMNKKFRENFQKED